mmetsp:Transcript_1025/g.1862  ORF Transcript_1025/g.1862 Transcript_1025/m.1862 type:complete len:231 (+) Transcript_1025:837-1529(+)
MGTMFLWFGWLMFNGGSTFAISGSNGIRSQRAMINTIITPCVSGLITYLSKSFVSGQKSDCRLEFTGFTNGILAGLVSVNAGADQYSLFGAIIIGVLSSITYSLAVRFISKVEIDDPLEVFEVHGSCGFLGCICRPFFVIEGGILYGGGMEGWNHLWVQFYGCVCIIAWGAIMSGLYFKVSQYSEILKVDSRAEVIGCDVHYFGPKKFLGKIEDYLDIRREDDENGSKLS